MLTLHVLLTKYQLSRSSTDTLPLSTINETSNEPQDAQPHWHTFSLLFVAVPAFAGLFHENGSSVMTDVLLLGLGCLFLHWSVKWPWQWYHAVQARIVLEPEDELDEDYAIVEESGEEEGNGATSKPAKDDKIDSDKPSPPKRNQNSQDTASKELRKHELLAFATCFLSPAGVAYLLHALRPYLSRPSGGLISNSNLTLFVLAAEVRPVFHMCKLIEARALYLQQVVTTSAIQQDPNQNDEVVSLLKRIESLESRQLDAPEEANGKHDATRNESDINGILAPVRQELQAQVDALNRAVRRYEKRATVQAADTEKRLNSLERRLNDALSLAAAASRMSQQRQGIVMYVLETASATVGGVMGSISSLLLLPFSLASDTYYFLFGPRRKKQTRAKASEPVYSGKSKHAQH